MKPILYIKGSPIDDVRIHKFISFFRSKCIDVYFWGWNRTAKKEPKCDKVKYLLTGGGFGGKLLLLYYPIWMVVLFCNFMFDFNLKKYTIIAINFECAFPLFLASKIRNIPYIYEVYDEFAISHRFSSWLKKMIVKIKNFFSEGGYLYKEEEKLYKIVRPVILSEIIDEMKKEGNRSVVKAMLY